MGRKCFIPNCKSGYTSCKEKICIFGAPKDEETLAKWQNVIPRVDKIFSRKDYVCAKHFRDEDILKEWTDGFNHIEHKVFRLKEGAYPSLYPNCPGYSNINNSKKRRQRKKINLSKSKKIKTVNTDSITESLLVETTENDDLDAISTTDITPEVPSTSTSLFDDIYNDKIIVTLPNKFWTVSKVADKTEPYIVFLKLISSTDAVPVIEKQIVLTESMNIKVFIHGKLLSDFTHEIISQKDISTILEELETLDVCRGINVEHGNVSENTQEENITVVDNCNILRHKNCTMKTASENICEYCSSLNHNLRSVEKNSQNKVVHLKLRKKQELNKRLIQYERKLQHTRENIAKLRSSICALNHTSHIEAAIKFDI